MTIDLHTHSTASDGTVPPEQLPHLAAAAGLTVVGLTDHDTLSGIVAAAASAAEAGIAFVPGVEISSQLGAVEVHLLGYYVDTASRALLQELERIRTDRNRRAIGMVERCRALGADITTDQVRAIAGTAPVGRPHIATALIAAGAVANVEAAFTPAWLADGGRADVAKHVVSVMDAVALVRSAGGVPILAHPRSAQRHAQVGDDALAELVAEGLAGFECDHPEHSPRERARLRGLAAELGVLATGASDFHGDRKPVSIGECTTAPDVLEALQAQAQAHSHATG